MKKVFLAVIALASIIKAIAQPVQRQCGTPSLPQQYQDWVQSLYSKPGKFGNATTQSIFYIPVVVHVIHNGENVNSTTATSGANLNAAQIQSQINILNADFNGTNADTTIIPAVFKPLLGKFQMVFCLAVVNPTGGVMAEPGIDRVNRVTKGWTASPYSINYTDANIKPNSIWDPNRYLNIWVCPLSNGILGYATFPNPSTSGVVGLSGPYGSATTDGVVINNSSFGNTGTAFASPYNRGRTATHEVGHWMGLIHVWGDSNCGTDYCNDTPAAQQANYGCKTHPFRLGTCTGNTTGEMFMNYMDYSDDACLCMFTADQKRRAQLIMTNSPLRASLITSTVCNLPNIGDDIGISSITQPTYSQNINCTTNAITPVVKITNYGSTTLNSVLLTYNLNALSSQTFSWTGSLAPGASTNVTLSQISNIPVGVNVFSVNVSAPNGGTDNNPTNNNSVQQFVIVNTFSLAVTTATTCSGVSVDISASGAPSYTWSNGSNSQTITVNPTANTVYTVNSGSGSCISTKTTAVTVFTTVLNVATSGNTLISCAGCNDGSVIATVSKGKGPYTFNWAPGAGTTNSLTNLAEGCYTVTVTDAYGCTGTSQFCVTFDTGLLSQNLSQENIKLLPNPNKGHFSLEFGDAKNRRIEVIDLLGRTVKSVNSSSTSASIDISEFSSGVYYVKVSSDRSLGTVKMVKE